MANQPLEGIRILDLGGVWAGTFATVLLADLGAEVLKQENQFIWQPNTRAVPGPRIPKAMAQRGPGWVTGLPNSDPGERPWNYHPMFVSLYRNKRSFTLDIRQPEGKEILGRLAAMSDAVLENSAVGTMEKLGISYEWLREQRDDIIFLRAPGYGITGEYASARTNGRPPGRDDGAPDPARLRGQRPQLEQRHLRRGLHRRGANRAGDHDGDLAPGEHRQGPVHRDGAGGECGGDVRTGVHELQLQRRGGEGNREPLDLRRRRARALRRLPVPLAGRRGDG